MTVPDLVGLLYAAALINWVRLVLADTIAGRRHETRMRATVAAAAAARALAQPPTGITTASRRTAGFGDLTVAATPATPPPPRELE